MNRRLTNLKTKLLDTIKIWFPRTYRFLTLKEKDFVILKDGIYAHRVLFVVKKTGWFYHLLIAESLINENLMLQMPLRVISSVDFIKAENKHEYILLAEKKVVEPIHKTKPYYAGYIVETNNT